MGDIINGVKGLFGQKETNDTQKKSGGMFDSLKFWDKDKEKETSEVLQSTKSELNSMYSNLMIVAQKLGVSTKLEQKDFEDGSNDKDDHWYEFLDSSKDDVKKLLIDISSSISKSSYAGEYSDLIKNIESYKEGSNKWLEGIKKVAGWLGLGTIYTSITEWIGSNDTLNSLLKVDMDKILSNINTDLGKLAGELQGVSTGDISNNDGKNDSVEQQNNGSITLPMKEPIVTSDIHGSRVGGKHNARDIVPSDNNNLDVFAVSDGVIEAVGRNGRSGNFVTIRHVDGFKSTYVHFDDKPDLHVGDSIKSGEFISKMGSLGKYVQGAHLHFSLKDSQGNKVDPATYFDPNQFKFKQDGKIVAFVDWKHANDYDDTTRSA